MPKSRKRKRTHPPIPAVAPAWVEEDGMHAILPGNAPTTGEIEALTRKYQERIRQSPFWDRMLKEYGPEDAERLLLQCKAEVRP